MDEPGFHARRRAQKEDTLPLTRSHTLAPTDATPEELWPQEDQDRQPPQYQPPLPRVPPLNLANGSVSRQASVTTASLPPEPLSAVERSQALPKRARMDPHLQFMCGPLLRYDTVIKDVWYGAAMIVTSDAGSHYSPHPSLTLTWDPAAPAKIRRDTNGTSTGASFKPSHKHNASTDIQPFDPDVIGDHHLPLARADGQTDTVPYLADAPPLANGIDAPVVNGHSRKPSITRQSRTVEGQEIWVYHGTSGTFTFWRFMIQIPLSDVEMPIHYSVNKGALIEFVVPAIGQNMRWAAHSCNGFSAGVNKDDFKGPGFQSGYDPLWSDLYSKHKEEPYHCMIGGGDQIYCDALTRELELQEWVTLKTGEAKIRYPLTDEIRFAIDRFYFNHYCLNFRQGVFARCNRSIPMVNMLDDHDLIDGFGSYPADLQSSALFSHIGSRGYFFYLLFQTFTVDGVDGTIRGAPHPNPALILGGDGPWIPYPGHSLLTYLGPKVYMLLLDCRAERRKERYDACFARIAALPRSVEHIVIQLGIPIAYPRMNFMESALESKHNPLVMLAKSGSLGLGSFVNKFNKEAELLDDLNDHWTASSHKAERNWLLLEFQKIAQAQHVRISIVSGDVHCAAVGCLKTLAKKKGQEIEPAKDRRYMLNIVTSAIVNTPPPTAVLTMVSYLGKRTHKTMHKDETDECMIDLFPKNPDGTSNKLNNIMGKRNYTSVQINESTGDLVFDIRVEKEKGIGATVGYTIAAPPPRWT
ncbi:hypothetical protein DL93DRAFT_2163184 [Clavulina sp. PMI_390]|nr:hypothetical protein DL93DRAFT_2163184 [Clavulina sp. PMI_390]